MPTVSYLFIGFGGYSHWLILKTSARHLHTHCYTNFLYELISKHWFFIICGEISIKKDTEGNCSSVDVWSRTKLGFSWHNPTLGSVA